MANNAKIPATVVSSEAKQQCFVCNVEKTVKWYRLAACSTRRTQTTFVEKLGQLLGERYVVVISQDDVICRRCAALIILLEKFEIKVKAVKNMVLGYMEKKYKLPAGELTNSEPTFSNHPAEMNSKSSFNTSGARASVTSNSESFVARKRRAALNEMARGQENGLPDGNIGDEKNDPKANMCLQCDKCKYTTNYTDFMNHHVHQYVSKRKCDFRGEEKKEGSTCSKISGTGTNAVENVNGVSSTAVSDEPDNADIHSKSQRKTSRKLIGEDGIEVFHGNEPDSGEANTVEMRAAEKNKFRGTGGNQNDVLISTLQDSQSSLGVRDTERVLPTKQTNKTRVLPTKQTIKTIIIDQNSQQLGLGKGENITIEVAGTTQHLAKGKGEQPTSISMMKRPQENSSDQPTLLTLQKMEDDSKTVYVDVVDVGRGEEMLQEADVIKRILTMAEDGTLDIVELKWDDVVAQALATEENN